MTNIVLKPLGFFKSRATDDSGRTNQLSHLHDMQRGIDRIFDDTLRSMSNPLSFFGRDMMSGFIPLVDVTEKDDKLIVSVEIPGVEKSDIKLSIEKDCLIISGEKKHHLEKNDEKLGVYHSESSYGSFRRVVELPSDINKDSIDAKFENGVLKITLPRNQPPEAKPKLIDIK